LKHPPLPASLQSVFTFQLKPAALGAE